MTRPCFRPRCRGIEARAYAKLNLALLVGPKRPDGYHDLITVFQSVSLHDTLIVRPKRRGFTLRVRGERGVAPGVSSSSRNLVLRAAESLAAATGLEGGARFTLVKRIPAGAGLGGGSSDAAAALRALARLYGIRLHASGLAALALGSGSDAPFFIRGGTALGEGRGERLRPLGLARRFRAVVVVPPRRSHTKKAFRQLDRRNLTLTVWRSKSSFFRRLCRAPIHAEEVMGLGNTFEEVIAESAHITHDIRERLLAAGALGARLTGSGSAVYGVFASGVSLSSLVESFDRRRFRVHVVTPTRVGATLAALT